MARLKLFTSCNGDIAALERSVNAWLEREHPRILQFVQTPLGQELALSFIYDVGMMEAHAEASEAAEVPDVFEANLDQAELDPTSDAPLLPEAELPY
jgi:hypothetical protein